MSEPAQSGSACEQLTALTLRRKTALAQAPYRVVRAIWSLRPLWFART